MQKGRIQHILILTADMQAISQLEQWLTNSPFLDAQLTFANSCAQGRRLLQTRPFDLCILDAPLSDELGLAFLKEFLGKKLAHALLLADQKLCEQLLDRTLEHSIALLVKPLTRLSFLSAMSVAQAAFAGTYALRSENAELLRRLESLRIIDRAKHQLMQHLGMTESQAHRYIEKQAMDLRVSKKTIAAYILKTYDN